MKKNCKECVMNDDNKMKFMKSYIEKSRRKPNGLSWFALGFSLASLIASLIKYLK